MTAQVLDIPTRPTATVVTITPEVAQRFLSQNNNNRNVRPHVVSQYARDMAGGDWQFTGEAVKFATDGTLLDGQHRLMACVKSGATITCLVVNGLPAHAQNVMDSGAKRQAADALRLAGVPHSTVVAAAARIALSVEEDKYGRTFKAQRSHTEILEWVDAHPDISDAAATATSLRDRIDAAPSVMAYVIWRCSRASGRATAEFFESIANSATDGKGDPRATLIARLQNARRNNESLSQAAQVSLLMRTWNAWRKGEKVQRLQVDGRSGDPIAIPTPR